MGINIKKAIIPVAGLGTRMLPATKAIPKELLPVYDRPIIEHVVREAVAGGISEIIFVTRSGKQAIENHFDVNYELEHRLEQKDKRTILGSVKNIIPDHVTITSTRQPDALGLGHAILCAKHLLNQEPFAVLLPDVLVLDKIENKDFFSFKKMMEAFNRSHVGQVMVETVEDDDIQNYGVVDTGDERIRLFHSSPVCGLVEKPKPENAPSNLALLGRYTLPYSIIGCLEETPAGFGGEIQLTDGLSSLMQMSGLEAFATDASTFDCGNKLGFIAANLAVSLRDIEARNFITAIYNKLLQ